MPSAGDLAIAQGKRMRKNEIIAKTLNQIDTCLFQYEVPYSQDSDCWAAKSAARNEHLDLGRFLTFEG